MAYITDKLNLTDSIVLTQGKASIHSLGENQLEEIVTHSWVFVAEVNVASSS